MVMNYLATFWNYEHKWTILFYIGIIIALYLFRKKFKFEGIIALLRTQYGIKFMDKISVKYREYVRLFGIVGIGIGFVILIGITILFGKAAINMVMQPIELDGSPLVLPGTKLAGMGGMVFPLVIGWLTLFIVVIVHEFSHGVVARAYKIPIKSTGIVFLGPILGAFVEPDEKKLEKADDIIQYSILSAGPFSNLILTIVILLLTMFVLAPISNSLSYDAGVELTVEDGYAAENAGIIDGTLINSVNGNEIENMNSFMNQIINVTPNETLVLSNDIRDYTLTVGSHPQNSTKGYLGVYIKNKKLASSSNFLMVKLYDLVEWFRELFFWVWFISLNVGLFNLFPIYMTDGARMLKVAFEKIIPDKKKAVKWWSFINMICLFMIFMMIFVPLFRGFF